MKDETLLTDEQAAFEKFMEENFRDSIDRRHVKNGDGGYFAWDMVVAWIVWQGRAALQSGNSGQVPAGYVLVPDALLSDLRDFSHPEIEKYCEMWAGRRDSEIPELRKIITDTDALLYSALKSQNAAPTVSDGWIPVSERMPEKCWCRTCRPITLNDMRFVVCPDCGNKRCPKANDHRNACTGSNEPGQEGSAYPDAPKGV